MFNFTPSMLRQGFQKAFSAVAVLFISLYMLYTALGLQNPRPISWDNFGYYLYLPQTFIAHDPGIQHVDSLDKMRQRYDLSPTLYQVHQAPAGNFISQYPIGMACFYLPGFIVGHCAAYAGTYPPDGYSAPYQYSQVYFSILFCIISFWLLRKLLLRYFSDGVTAITLLLAFFATNYYVYATVGYGTPHTCLFLAYVVVILLSIRVHESKDLKSTFALGFVLGLMAVTRPTEILAAIIPALWSVHTIQDFRHKVKNAFTVHRKHLLVMALGFAILPMAQSLYWKIYTGQFLYYSYRNPGEGFEFLHPHTFDFLFSFRKGWFLYTPIMLLALVFLFFGRQKQQAYWLPFVVFTCINVYVLSCWSNWWYATSFGERALVQSSPLYLFGLAVCFSGLQQRKMGSYVLLVLSGALCVLNLFQIWQMNHGIIDLSRMTKDYYVAVFGKTQVPPGADSLLLVERSVELCDVPPHADWYKNSREIYVENKAGLTFDINSSQGAAPQMFDVPYCDLTQRDFAWINISLEVQVDSTQKNTLMLSPCFMNKRSEAYAWNTTPVKDHLMATGKGWSRFSIYYLTPELRLKTDKLHVQIENPGHGHFKVRNFKVTVYERKVEH